MSEFTRPPRDKLSLALEAGFLAMVAFSMFGAYTFLRLIVDSIAACF